MSYCYESCVYKNSDVQYATKQRTTLEYLIQAKNAHVPSMPNNITMTCMSTSMTLNHLYHDVYMFVYVYDIESPVP